MRIEEGRIQSFGPFAGTRLALAPGMTVIFGPNEAGKSTWHAALYAALCGIRRGRGKRLENRDFADKHRPWDGDAWKVSAVIRLQDGRRIEIGQDLDGRVDCRAVDLSVGHDVSAEIMNDGAPDASRWLGLDRRTFLATACVRQSEILAVSASPDELQESLQRAAATAGADETAARALVLLEEFQREHVGLDRANTTKPFRCALEQRQRAEHAFVVAQQAHDEHVNLASEAESLEVLAGDAARSVRVSEAAIASRKARDWGAKLDRARELAARHHGPAPDLQADDELAQAVATALKAWTDMPALPGLKGPDSGELRRQIKELPTPPVGDLEAHAEVVSASTELEVVRRALARHASAPPADPENLQVPVGEDQLRELAHELEGPQSLAGPGARRRRTAALLAAIVLVCAGGVAVALESVLHGLVAIALGISVGAFALLRGERLARQRTATEERGRRRAEAVALTRRLGLSSDSGKLRELANRLAEVSRRRTALESWKSSCEALRLSVANTEQRLAEALASRQARSFEEYVNECAQRRARAQKTLRRPDLETQVLAREALERIAHSASAARSRAAEGIREVAARCGIAGMDDALMADALREWRRQHAGTVKEHATAVQERAELDAILGDSSLESFEAACQRYREMANQLTREISSEQLAAAELKHDAAEHMPGLRSRAAEAAQLANQTRGQVSDRARRLPSVPEAEEGLATAIQELERVRALDEIIKLTEQFLGRAQERVHRDIAPVLAGTLKKWLPRVTAGRYSDAIVDPQNLSVKVSGNGGPWREANLLSHGTREQVYLLLRMAIAQHLTAPDEVCPLLFDEVTVQGDSGRTTAILDLLHEMSRDRQIVLFTQEDQAHGWARAHLREPQDRLLVLESRDVSI